MAWTIAAAALIVASALAGGGVWLLTRPAPAPVVRTEIATSAASALSIGGIDRDVAISPDGSHIVYRGNGRLLVRALDQIEPTVLTGLGAPRGVFFSPDGQWIGFADGTALKKVAITGGPAVTICSFDAAPRGATWGPDGTIVFATNNVATGLFRVSEGGGKPTVLTKPNRERGEADHLWPELLPGGQAVLFTITTTGGTTTAQVAVLDLRTGAQKIVVRGGSHAHYVESGHLVYAAAGTLRAVRFDLKRLGNGRHTGSGCPRGRDHAPGWGRLRRGPQRHAGVPAWRCSSHGAHAGVARPPGPRRGHQSPASGLRGRASRAGWDADRARHPGPGERHLGLGPGPRDAHPPDLRSDD